MIRIAMFLVFVSIALANQAKTIVVCPTCETSRIADAILAADSFDRIQISEGTYNEFDVVVDKPLSLIGVDHPVIDVLNKGYGLIIQSNNVSIKGLKIVHIGTSYTKDFAAIYLTKVKDFNIERCILENVFFGILIEKSHRGAINNNHISSDAVVEAGSGNGVHMWHCSEVTIDNNLLHNLRDGIYFEFVTNSVITNNLSHHNLRYGLHFMFSNNNEYHYNTFKYNGAGVAVMFSKFIKMTHNVFTQNWGSASYGLLLKEIYDAEIEDNIIEENTIGIYAEGSTRINYNRNNLVANGWAIKISGACYTNLFHDNNFLNNSFDVSYNSKVNDNNFDHNFWSSYTGYDLDKNGIGDVPFRPVKLFSYIVNRTPETILLLRSLFVEILNFSEKVSPVFTPDNLMDNEPLMKKAS